MSPDYSGTNPYQRRLADALTDRGVDVELVDARGPLGPLRTVREEGLPDVFHLHWLHSFLVGRSAPFTLIKGVLLLGQLLVLRLLGVRLVWTVHNVVEHDARTPRLERAFKHLVVRLCDAVVVHCESASDTVRRAFRLPDLDGRIHVVPHGHYVGSYPDEVSRAEARADLGIGDEFLFLYFGRIAEYKNVPRLIATFGGLEAPGARLLVAGNPTSEHAADRVESVAAAHDGVRTELGFVPSDRIQYYMNAADVVVLPFAEILTSGSTVLAASFGKPVVVPAEGCVGSLLPEDGGFTYPKDVSGALGATMERAMEADLEAVGRANYRAVRDRDWDGIARRTLASYGLSPGPPATGSAPERASR